MFDFTRLSLLNVSILFSRFFDLPVIKNQKLKGFKKKLIILNCQLTN